MISRCLESIIVTHFVDGRLVTAACRSDGEADEVGEHRHRAASSPVLNLGHRLEKE